MDRRIAYFSSAVLLGFVGLPRCLANDSAASVGAGGIVLKREARISIKREVLRIDARKITVEYEFSNDSRHDITTDVAFPVPPFDCVENRGVPCGESDIAHFRVWDGNKELQYKRQTKALVGGRDYASELSALGIDMVSFGHFGAPFNVSKDYEVAKLPSKDKDHLVQLGLIDPRDLAPKWSVEELFYWKQIFPAGKLTHIRHEYQPTSGFTPMTARDLVQLANHQHIDANVTEDTAKFLADLVETSCVEPSLADSIKRTLAQQHKNDKDLDSWNDVEFGISWVDYILTTANSWKTPIKDFTLIIERPEKEDKKQHYLSFCWDGPVRRLDSNHFVAKATNFTPKKQLRIAYFDF